MKKSIFKSVLAMFIATMMAMTTSSICFAEESNDSAVAEMENQVISLVEEENGTPLSLTSEDGIMPLADQISDFRAGTTTGYIYGSFTVPNDCSGRLIKIAWAARVVDDANSSAVFKLRVAGNTVLLPVTGSSAGYAIGNLPAGTYSYSIEPYSNVSGEYFYGFQFYAY